MSHVAAHLLVGEGAKHQTQDLISLIYWSSGDVWVWEPSPRRWDPKDEFFKANPAQNDWARPKTHAEWPQFLWHAPPGSRQFEIGLCMGITVVARNPTAMAKARALFGTENLNELHFTDDRISPSQVEDFIAVCRQATGVHFDIMDHDKITAAGVKGDRAPSCGIWFPSKLVVAPGAGE